MMQSLNKFLTHPRGLSRGLARRVPGVLRLSGMAAAALAVAFLGASASGQTNEPAGTNLTVIKSERLTYDYKRSIAVFDGNVVVRDPRMRIQSDSLTVLMNPDGSIKSATAVGRVHLRQEEKVGTCDKAIYLALTGEVMLCGHAKLDRGEDSVQGNLITFFLNDSRMTCEPAYLIINQEARDSAPAQPDKESGKKPPRR
jgi:lipopolysaccharide export system protein LptA